MKFCTPLLALTLAFALTTSTYATITINEIRIDQPSTDDSEYFELAGDPGESLGGLTYLVIGDDSGDGSGLPGSRSGSVEAVVPLDGFFIPADTYFLAAETTYGTGSIPLGGTPDATFTTELNFENSDNVTHMLVSGFTGAVGDLLDSDRDGTLDVFPWTSVLDAISIIETLNPPTVEQDEWDYGFGGGIGPDGTFVPGHVYRFPNKTGPWNIGVFAGGDDTPGVANVPEPAAMALLALGALALVRRSR